VKVGTSASYSIVFITSTDIHYHRNPFGLEFYSANGIVEDDLGIFFAAVLLCNITGVLCVGIARKVGWN